MSAAGRPVPHESARGHVTGQALYVDDLAGLDAGSLGQGAQHVRREDDRMHGVEAALAQPHRGAYRADDDCVTQIYSPVTWLTSILRPPGAGVVRPRQWPRPAGMLDPCSVLRPRPTSGGCRRPCRW